MLSVWTRILIGVVVPLGIYFVAASALVLTVPSDRGWTSVGGGLLTALYAAVLMFTNWWVVLIRWKRPETLLLAGLALPAFAWAILYLVIRHQAVERIVNGWFFTDTWPIEPVSLFLMTLAGFFVPMLGAVLHAVARR